MSQARHERGGGGDPPIGPLDGFDFDKRSSEPVNPEGKDWLTFADGGGMHEALIGRRYA